MENQNIDQLADAHAKSFTHLTELEGIVIRGQVLVEHNLNRAIRLTIPEKEEYKAEKFSFSQILILGHMLGISNAFKGELNALNKLRNQIAHGSAFDDKYIDIIITEVKKKSPDSFKIRDSKVNELKVAISFICGAISITPNFSSVRTILKQLERTKQNEVSPKK